MNVLTEPLTYGFFTRALVAGICMGAMCGVVSVFVVLRRMSYIGHGLSHSVLGGVAVALVFGVNIYLGAALASVVSAVLIHRTTKRRGLHADTAIGVVTIAMFALGVLVTSLTSKGRVNTEALLFGNVLAVAPEDLVVVAATTTIVAILLFCFIKPLLFVTFDPAVAAAHGIHYGRIEALFYLLVVGVIVVSVQILGVLLVAAAVVIPAAVARLTVASLGWVLAVAAMVGVISSIAGLYISYYVNAPSGPTIVLTAAAIFLIVGLVTAARPRWHRSREPTTVPTPFHRGDDGT